jgi:predicted Zn-dependent protease
MNEVAEPVNIGRVSVACRDCTPAERAAGVAEAIWVVQSSGQTAAGIYSTAENVEAVVNSRGAFQYYTETLTTFSITALAEDSSGWAKATSPVYEDVQPVALAERAARKAKLSAKPREIDPGNYTVILEPAAVLDFVGQIFHDFSATALADRRSFLTDRSGEKLFGSNITIFDDVRFPLQSGAPFDGEGVARRTLTLVKHGCLVELPYSRSMAARERTEATGHGFPVPNEEGEAPVNIIIAGGTTTVHDMIASTRRGILVTRCWYVRETEPYDKFLTGMTRDGTFLIEDGEIVAGVRNLRFNDSVVRVLSNVEALSASVRTSGEETFDMVVPAMKVNDFTFTEVTKY